MSRRYHGEIKRIVSFYFNFWRLDFIKFNWKWLNLLKLVTYPIFALTGLFCSTWHVFYQMDDYSDLIDLSFSIVYVFAMYQAGVIYLTINILNKNKIQNILEHFDRLYNTQSDMMKDFLLSFFARIFLLNFLLIFFRFFLGSITIFGVIIVIFDMHHSKFHMPMLYYFPWIPQDSFLFYPCNIIMQVVFYFTTLEIMTWSDTIIMIVIMYCDAETRTLNEFISELDRGNNVRKGAQRILRTIYKNHLSLSEQAKQFTECVWHIYFHKLLSMTLYLCSILFIFQSLDTSLIVPVLAFLITIGQIFILCYFGQIIRDSSEITPDTLYMTKWYELNTKDQKKILMLLTKIQNSVKVETFGFGEISIYTFVQVIFH
uniref:Odorant receptor n=1 Tax=Lutzomyia longipalpis TaxID=7200 RepID=A0A7G3AL71_LUTLO